MSQKQLGDVRARIARARDELESLSSIKRNRADVATSIEKTVASWLKKADQIGSTNTARLAAGDHAAFLTINARVAGVAVAIDLGPIAVLLLGADAVNTALSAHLAGIQEGVSAVAKAKKIDQLTVALDGAQYEEEGIIRTLEEAGETVAYRGDANPHYALTWRAKK